MKHYIYDIVGELFKDANGSASAARPSLVFGEKPGWELELVDEAGSPADLSGVVAWQAAVAQDFSSETAPMVRVASGIFADGNVVTVPRLDTLTQQFLAVVDGKRRTECFFELRGLDGDGAAVLTVQFDVTCRMSIDPYGVDPDEVPDGAASIAYVEAAAARAPVVEFSADGSSWHSAMGDADRWIRARHGANGLPGAALPFRANPALHPVAAVSLPAGGTVEITPGNDLRVTAGGDLSLSYTPHGEGYDSETRVTIVLTASGLDVDGDGVTIVDAFDAGAATYHCLVVQRGSSVRLHILDTEAAATASRSYIVSGAGDPSADGTYEEIDATVNGHPVYSNGLYRIWVTSYMAGAPGQYQVLASNGSYGTDELAANLDGMNSLMYRNASNIGTDDGWNAVPVSYSGCTITETAAQ